MDIYALVRGPFAWIALMIFAVGSLYQVIAYDLSIEMKSIVELVAESLRL